MNARHYISPLDARCLSVSALRPADKTYQHDRFREQVTTEPNHNTGFAQGDRGIRSHFDKNSHGGPSYKGVASGPSTPVPPIMTVVSNAPHTTERRNLVWHLRPYHLFENRSTGWLRFAKSSSKTPRLFLRRPSGEREGLGQKRWMNPYTVKLHPVQLVCIRPNRSRLCWSRSRAWFCAARASAE